MTDLTPAAKVILTLASTLITAYLIPWIRGKTSAQKTEEMLKWVDIAVAAAQQLYHSLEGDARKKYVVNFLEARGYSVDGRALDAAIEAAVLKLHRDLRGGSNGNS